MRAITVDGVRGEIDTRNFLQGVELFLCERRAAEIRIAMRLLLEQDDDRCRFSGACSRRQDQQGDKKKDPHK